jgi:hypothetical protein
MSRRYAAMPVTMVSALSGLNKIKNLSQAKKLPEIVPSCADDAMVEYASGLIRKPIEKCRYKVANDKQRVALKVF